MSETWVPCYITKPHMAHRASDDRPCPGVPSGDARYRYAEDLARRMLPAPRQRRAL